jgi:AraC family transcriptional regulator
LRRHLGVTPEDLCGRARRPGLHLEELIGMKENTSPTSAPPRVVRSDALLVFGLAQRYHGTNAGMPSQWERFVAYLGTIPGQIGRETYGVICNTDEAGTIDYICGVRVREFPADPPEFTRLRIAPQTYAVFEHRDHVSTLASTWQEIWNHGLADSGHQAAAGPAFERYGEGFDGRTGLGGLEIWVPIAS